VRSFKARGALAALARLDVTDRARGVATASTGNHGQGVAFAGGAFGIPVTVAVPQGADGVKITAMEELGALLLDGGASLSEAEDVARRHASETGAVYLEDGEDPGLMAGAATVAWEMLEAAPDLDTIVVPVGGGNLIAATLLAASLLRPDVHVVGVQSTAAPGTTRSWLAGRIIRQDSRTFAGGLATDRPGKLSLAVMDALLGQMVLVDEDDLRASIATAYDAIGLPAEAAAVAGLAALDRFGDQIPGEHVGVVVTGGRIGADDLCAALARR
jgi:threonine dehydratase